MEERDNRFQYLMVQNSKFIGEDWWTWEVWIEGSDSDLDKIAYVVYTLHPTFVNPVRRIDDRSSKFKLREEGWGGFKLFAKVVINSGESVSLEHDLTMTYPDGTEVVEFEKEADKAFTNLEFQNYSTSQKKGLANRYNDIIQNYFRVYGAWPPVTNDFELGDYGIITDGIFTKMGNIREYGISFSSSTGPESSIDFITQETRIRKFVSGIEVNKIPLDAVDAKITYQFKRERSFLLKASLTVNLIENVIEVANKLREINGWQRKWKVIHQRHHARHPVIISTGSEDTVVSFVGNGDALEKANLGDESVQMTSSKELELYINGKEGVIAIALFKLKLSRLAATFLSDREKTAQVEVSYLAPGADDQ